MWRYSSELIAYVICYNEVEGLGRSDVVGFAEKISNETSGPEEIEEMIDDLVYRD